MFAIVTRSAASSPTQAEHENDIVECCPMNISPRPGKFVTAAEFADIFDVCSIGVDRDSEIVVTVFNEPQCSGE